jgi:hypothetical protein
MRSKKNSVNYSAYAQGYFRCGLLSGGALKWNADARYRARFFYLDFRKRSFPQSEKLNVSHEFGEKNTRDSLARARGRT